MRRRLLPPRLWRIDEAVAQLDAAPAPGRRCSGRGSPCMTVLPCAWSFAEQSSSTSWPVFESSAPVGSSASRSAGRLASARAMATRWRWPPERAAGQHARPCPECPPVSSSSSARSPALLARDAGVEHRQLDVAHDRRLGQQVVLLEDEADLLVADRRQLGARQLVHLPPVEGVAARRRQVEAAEDRHQRALAGPRGADQGDELALLDASCRCPRRACTALPLRAVDLGQASGFDDFHVRIS